MLFSKNITGFLCLYWVVDSCAYFLHRQQGLSFPGVEYLSGLGTIYDQQSV